MIDKIKTTLAASTFALSLIAAPALAQEYGDWDTDGAAGINESEFRTGFENNTAFDTWDANDDSALTEDEFGTGIGDNESAFNDRFGDGWFNEWDADSNDSISEDEYYDGVYAGYDANNNNVIEEPEFGDVGDDMGDGGLFDI
ncbi:EF-hand domain-containing protein [Rhizobium halophilum]|uniref:hypothetical protein n=1 Tax=Rhizobium halophilum TaxID=2846852 RepID=UPI001EFE68D0|nr:hypothetical protein [Rhizobium halophilum]MCF6370682.1 hypothetical protein [Rhizobium halophilum]